jgi:hypothetical protein
MPGCARSCGPATSCCIPLTRQKSSVPAAVTSCYFPRPAHPHPRPASAAPAAPTGKLLRHRHPRMKQSSSSRTSAQPVPTSSKSVRPGPGGPCPEAAIFALWPWKPGLGLCFLGRAEPAPGVIWAVEPPNLPSRPGRWRQKPDLSEKKRLKALPTHAPATRCS